MRYNCMVSGSKRSRNWHGKEWKQHFKWVLNRSESKCTSLKISKVDSLENKRRNAISSWLKIFTHQKALSIMSVLEQMVETRSWKAAQGLVEDGRCRVSHVHDETVKHLEAECIALFNSEYLTRDNRVLTILPVTWVKEHKLIGADTVWYKDWWERGMILENDKAKLVWDFLFSLRKSEAARRPSLILETKYEKKIWICDMAYPMQKNIDTKWRDNLMQCWQLAFETRERRPGYTVIIVPVIIGALGGGM